MEITVFFKKFFKNIRKDSYLINTSRGDLFNENQLINIKFKQYNGFGFDVLQKDVIWKSKISKKYNFLKNLNGNFYVTPHIGGNSIESRNKTALFMIKKFLKYKKNK